MKENKRLITKQSKLLAKRKPIKPKPRADRPNQIWGTDMSKVMIASFGWVYLHIVLDWYSKEIIGFSVSFQSKTEDWLDALHRRSIIGSQTVF
jgi:putative transposase